MKKIIILFCFIASVNIASAQEYDGAGGAFESIAGPWASMEELFGKRDSAFSVTEYLYNENTGKLDRYPGCAFYFSKHGVIKTRRLTKRGRLGKVEYWKFVTQGGDPFGNVELSNKKGKIIERGSSFEINVRKGTITDSSVVEKRSYFVYKKDTALHYIEKNVYYKDTLLEYWSKFAPNAKSPWTKGIYSIKKYSYPGKDTTITQRFRVDAEGKMTDDDTYITVKSYNAAGKITFEKYSLYTGSLPGHNSETRHYYRTDGKWYRTERWWGGMLQQVVEIKTIVPKHATAKRN